MIRPKRFYRHMTPARADEIRQLYFAKLRLHTQKQLAVMFGVVQSSISKIISGRVWERVR